MIVNFLTFMESIAISLNFVCHVIIFLGGLYIALKSTRIPNWLCTPLWYVGLASFLNVIVIFVEWAYGPMFPFAYTQVSVVTETILNMCLSATVGIYLLHMVIDKFKK